MGGVVVGIGVEIGHLDVIAAGTTAGITTGMASSSSSSSV
jgi:hypothetical protein